MEHAAHARPGRRLAIVAAFGFFALTCSHKSPVGVEEPVTPEVFFNWLPALLVDQGQASQPAHEIMSWLDDQSNYPVVSKAAELDAIIDRLGECTTTYRQTGAYQPTDEPVLSAIDAYVDGARAFLAGTHHFTPATTNTQREQIERDRG